MQYEVVITTDKAESDLIAGLLYHNRDIGWKSGNKDRMYERIIDNDLYEEGGRFRYFRLRYDTGGWGYGDTFDEALHQEKRNRYMAWSLTPYDSIKYYTVNTLFDEYPMYAPHVKMATVNQDSLIDFL